MKGINTVHYVGSISKELELKYTPGGLAILELTVAGKEIITKSDGTAKTSVFYNRCKCFAKYAEALAGSFRQGDIVSVQGRLEYSAWDKDGEKRSTVETVISSIQTLTGRFITDDDSRGQPVLQGGINFVTIGGNLTRDAELKYTPSGNSVTQLSIAVNERYGEGSEKVGFFELQAWGELAETLAEGAKGQGIIGVGHLVNDAWTDKDGNKRYGTKVELSRAFFVSSGPGQGEAVSTLPAPTCASSQQTAPISLREEFPPEEELPF